jgi:SAM-dependent methyltransferase
MWTLSAPLWRRSLTRAFAIAHPRRVLDVGCGPFREEPYVDALQVLLPPDGEYVGVDIREDAIDAHRRESHDDERFRYIAGDFLTLPPPAEPFDLVLTKCFVCLFFGGDQFAVIQRLRATARWWLLYDSFKFHGCAEPDIYLGAAGHRHFWHVAPEGNPEYTRCGLIEFSK